MVTWPHSVDDIGAFLITWLPIIFFGSHAVSRRLTATLLLLFATMALLPGEWLGPTLPHGHYVAAAMISFAWTVVIVTMFVSRINAATVEASCALAYGP